MPTAGQKTKMLAKSRIRAEVLKKRNEISLNIKALKDDVIKERLFSLKEFKSAKSIMFYTSIRSEVYTLGMIREALWMGKKVSLPRVDVMRHCLKIYEVKETGELTPGYMGIPEPLPQKNRLRSLNSIDMVIMPGVAFDPTGGRLGYGEGYYDRLLRRRGILKTALAYEEQIVRHIPSDEHDVRVDAIVTEERVIWTKKRLKKE